MQKLINCYLDYKYKCGIKVADFQKLFINFFYYTILFRLTLFIILTPDYFLNRHKYFWKSKKN